MRFLGYAKLLGIRETLQAYFYPCKSDKLIGRSSTFKKFCAVLEVLNLVRLCVLVW